MLCCHHYALIKFPISSRDQCDIISFLFQAVTILMRTHGFKKAVSVFVEYPALLLMSMFSYWTVGSASKQSCFCGCSRGNIIISYKNTWINVVMSACGYCIAYFVTWLSTFSTSDLILFHLFLPLLPFSIVCFILVQCVTCRSCQPNGFTTNCCPLAHRTEMNV